jgi:ATP-binding cassette subfamily F protein uup
MESPNVLMLDEPTNDFDIEILTELEDLLDSYAGTLLIISHDRYFLERVCDRFVGLLGDKKLLDLPRGVDQYLELREKAISGSSAKKENKSTSSAAEQRQAKKDLARIERQIAKLDEKISALLAEQELSEFDAPRLAAIATELVELSSEKSRREEEWLAATVLIEG